MNTVRANWLILIGLLLSVVVGAFTFATHQASKEATTRSAQVDPPIVNLKFDQGYTIDGKYVTKVFAKSAKQGAEIFGINLRFFYDGADLGVPITFTNFVGGYGGVGLPRTTTGTSGTMLGFKGPARYCNSVIQLNNTSKTPILLDTAKWVRLFDIEFPQIAPEVSCTSLVWEKMPNWKDGGFVGGSAGLVITIVKDRKSPIYTTNTAAVGLNQNWDFKLPVIKGKYPYGNIKCPVAPIN